MTHPALHTPFCELVGIRYPIVQTGMGWVAGPRLVAATAEAGGLGILASATMTYDELVTAIAEVRSRTDRPFGVNMRTDVADVGDRVAVIAAGGFFDGRGLVAALAYGASGIAMGTRFLLTQESRVPDGVKDLYLKTPVTGTVVSTAVDGAPQRVIRTELVDHLEKAGRLRGLPRALANAHAFRKETDTTLLALMKEGTAMKKGNDLSWPQVVMAANAPMMTKAALVDGRTDVGVLPTGQVVGEIGELPTVAELIARIVAEADDVLTRLSGVAAPATPPS